MLGLRIAGCYFRGLGYKHFILEGVGIFHVTDGAADFFTWPATPSLPLPPMLSAAGHFTALLARTFSFHAGETMARWLEKIKVVPEPSVRCATVMAWEGSFRPGLRPLMAGSSHWVILPR